MNFSSSHIYQSKSKSTQPRQQQNLLDLSVIPEGTINATASSLIPPPPPLPAPSASCLNFDESDDDEPDTNVVTIKFDKLKDPTSMQAGDAIKCNNCDAYLSSISKLGVTVSNDDRKLWRCEFCDFTNNIQVEDEEVPKVDDVSYMLEAAPGVQNAATAQDIYSEYVVYCIDISGSMSVTSRVAGNFRLPTDHVRNQRAAEMAGEPVFGGHRQVYAERYISRLEAVQLAISENLSKLVKDSPNKRVGLVTFNQEVHSYGDGSTQEVTISGDFLNKKESIAEKANLTGEFKPVSETNAVLNNKVLNLEEGGATALGPALYYSILIASRKPGSKVILCTDGLANKGIGALDTDDDQSTYYNELATFATSKGVSVSIITIKGTDCKLGLLAEVADKTGGIVNIVDPLNVRNEFASILEDQIIATNVTAKFLLHKAMYVKDFENFNSRQSVITRTIGNATSETEVTFEFALKENIDENIKEIPFQLQIVYNAKDGSKALRILTQMKPLTTDKTLAERNADRTILAQHFVQSNTRLMKRGKQTEQLYKTRHQKWDGYLKNKFMGSNATSVRADDFSEVAYNTAVTEMSDVIQTTDDLNGAAASATNSNAFANVSDSAASKGFKLANFKSKFLKK